jgi:hypothetical protein
MTAKLLNTTLDVHDQTVAMTVDLTVQGISHYIQCTASSSALLARATANGRTDWTTADCVAEAASLLGLPVTV